jgi:hypothetical protein
LTTHSQISGRNIPITRDQTVYHSDFSSLRGSHEDRDLCHWLLDAPGPTFEERPWEGRSMKLSATGRRPSPMPKSKSRKKKAPKRVLALPDLEHAKTAVLNGLTSASGQRTYEHAIREFVTSYCSEPRLAFNRTVVLRYRIHLEQRGYAPATINLRLAAVRRIAYEAADAGLLSPELAAGIRRVKGVRRIGVRLGNWLTPEQGRGLVGSAVPSTARPVAGSRDGRNVDRLWPAPRRAVGPAP